MPQIVQILIELLIVAVVITINITVQTLGSIGLLYWTLRTFQVAETKFNLVWRVSIVIRIIFAFILLHLVQIVIWAIVYLLFGAFPTFEESFYFSLATFSTSDTGNSTLPPDWRLLGPFEGLAGIVAFGLSIGFIFTVISRLNETRIRRAQEAQAKENQQT